MERTYGIVRYMGDLVEKTPAAGTLEWLERIVERAAAAHRAVAEVERELREGIRLVDASGRGRDRIAKTCEPALSRQAVYRALRTGAILTAIQSVLAERPDWTATWGAGDIAGMPVLAHRASFQGMDLTGAAPAETAPTGDLLDRLADAHLYPDSVLMRDRRGRASAARLRRNSDPGRLLREGGMLIVTSEDSSRPRVSISVHQIDGADDTDEGLDDGLDEGHVEA